jgi:hypothetical protein
MHDQTIEPDQNEIDALRYEPTDEDIEAAADATALSYTYQTSAYRRCC